MFFGRAAEIYPRNQYTAHTLRRRGLQIPLDYQRGAWMACFMLDKNQTGRRMRPLLYQNAGEKATAHLSRAV
jgi:hypothetical protein